MNPGLRDIRCMMRPSIQEYPERSMMETELVEFRDDAEVLGDEERWLLRVLVPERRVALDELDETREGTSECRGAGSYSSILGDFGSRLKSERSESLPLTRGEGGFDEKVEKNEGAGDVARDRSVFKLDLLTLLNDEGKDSEGLV
jgi:hypothetical protein